MNSIIDFFYTPFMYATGWAIVHSLWVSIAIYSIASLLQYFTPVHRSDIKYNLSFGAQSSIFLITTGVFYSYLNEPQQSINDLGIILMNKSSTEITYFYSNNIKQFISQQTPAISLIWACGIVLLLTKFVFGYRFIYQLRKTSVLVNEKQLSNAFKRIAFQLNIKKVCELRSTDQIVYPFLAGFYRPFVVLPMAMINSLDVSEVELILAHELAHLKRYDHIGIIVQRTIESVLYYNPMIWILSQQINKYREEACDDLVTHHMNCDVHYVKSLVKLQELIINQSRYNLVLSAVRSKNQLLNRIKRILNMETKNNYHLGRTFLVLLFSLCFGLFSFYSRKNNQLKSLKKLESKISTIPVQLISIKLDTMPVRQNRSRTIEKIVKKTNDQKIEAEFESGKVKYLEINGEQVDPADHYQIIKDLKIELSGDIAIQSLEKQSRPRIEEYEIEKDQIDQGSYFENFNPGMNDMIHRFQFHFPDSFPEKIPLILKFYENLIDEHENLINPFEDPHLFEEFDHPMNEEQIHEFKDKISELLNDKNTFMFKMEDINEWIEGFSMGAERWEEEFSKDMENWVRKFEKQFEDMEFPNEIEESDEEDQILRFENLLRDRNTTERDYPIKLKKSVNLRTRIEHELRRDGFISKNGSYSIKLKEGKLRINGKKQSYEMYRKYKDIYEKYSGSSIQNSQFSTKISGV